MPLSLKKEVTRKTHEYMRNVRKNNNQVGTIPRCIAIDYNNICNYKCEFCYEREEEKYNHLYLDFDLLRRVADEAHELGVWEVLLQGGELLIQRDRLFKIIEAIGAERFRVTLVTNGSVMTQEYANELADKGIDCVGISISSLNAQEHDQSRGGYKGAHQKALAALEYSKNAGMTVWTQTIFGHHNSHSQELIDFLEYNKGHGYGTYFLLAMPYGSFTDSKLDGEDLKILGELRKKYNVWLDQWDLYDVEKERKTGCIAVNRIFITPNADVLPCPFINISIGNLKEKSLKEIFDYGFSIKYFSEYSPVCLAAQNMKFREKYLQGNTSMFEAPLAKEVFHAEDFISCL